MLLDIRLAELGDVVDRFVLIESNITFSGKSKPLYFSENMEKYKHLKDKIIPLVCHCDKPDSDRWQNERIQRISISDYLKTVCKPDDLIILTDADEIPSKEAVMLTEINNISGKFLMKMYYYWFNCQKDEIWKWPSFCRYHHFVDAFKSNAQSMRLSDSDALIHIENAGWHFSYIMPPEKIAEKLGAFSHSEYDKPPFTDIDWITSCMMSGRDLFGRHNTKYQFTDLSDLPKVIRNNPEKYKEFIYDHEQYTRRNSVLQESKTA